jgi:hypothetical protein
MGEKKRKSRLLPLLLWGGAAFLVIRLARGVSSVLVGNTTTMVHKVSLQGLELRTFLTVINQGQLTLDVQNFLGQILYHGAGIAIVRQVRPVRLQPMQTAEVEFSSEISWASLGMQFSDELLTLWKSGKLPIDLSKFTIKGTLRAENLSIPVNQPLLV